MAEYTITIKNQTLRFITNEKVFSPGALDTGTAAMLSTVEFLPGDKVLDLGCGYGPVGILAAKLTAPGQVTMCDVSEDALRLAKENAARNGIPMVQDGAPPADGFLRILKSDGLRSIPDRDYTKILSNPPYHTDFSVAKAFIKDGYSHLAAGGVMYMVTKRRAWYKNKLIAVFGGVHIDEIDGYYVFTAEKRVSNTRTEKERDLHETMRPKIPGSMPSPQKNEQKQKLSKKLARKAKKKRRI